MYTSYTEFRIPSFIIEIFDYLEKNGFSEVGLFRISGASTEILDLKEYIDQTGGNEFIDFTKYSIHSLASTLKLFFRELPEPVN